MSLKYVELPRNLLSLSDDALKSLCTGIKKDSVLLRSILMSEVATCKKTKPQQRTLRGLWYQLVKPVLSRLGLLDKHKNHKRGWDKLLSVYLVELVDTRVCDYETLGIVDGSRQRQPPARHTLSIKKVPVVEKHHPNIIILSEKDSIFHVIKPVANIFGLACYSAGGQSSYAAIENLVKRMVRDKAFWGDEICLLTLTDYDPAGYIIDNAVVEQVRKVAGRLGIATIRHKRLGIQPHQIDPDTLWQNAYTPSRKNLNEWFAQTGGVEGEPLGLELDCLTFDEIRDIFVTGIKNIIPDETPYHKTIGQATLEMLIYETLKDDIQSLVDEMYEAIDGDKVLDELECDADIVAQFTRIGDPYIHPLDDDIFGKVDEIRAMLAGVN